MGIRGVVTAAFLFALPAVADARLAISSNDGKQIQAAEQTGVTPDSISVIDLAAYPPTVIGQVQVPAAMIGPPEAVAVSRDDSFAIVTAAQKINPADAMHPLDNDQVSVIDLSRPAEPRVLQTVAVGAVGVSGVAMNRAQNLVLVAAKMSDAVVILRLAGKKLTPVGKIDLGTKAQPTDVVFAPDGRHAYVVAQGVNKLMELSVDGTKVAL